MKIVSVAQMRALEAAAFGAGTSEPDLQRQAGHAVAEEVFRLLQPAERVTVLVGYGNNGRDGAVAAEWLAQRGTPIDLVLAPRHAVTPDELAALRRRGATVTLAADGATVEAVLRSARVALDGLLGIGATGALREPLASMARTLNSVRAERGRALAVVALDLPSGIDADTGAVPGEAVRADVTVTLGGVKQGLLRFPAAAYVGRLVAREIAIPDAAQTDLAYEVLDEATLRALVPERPLDAHKYRFGRVLVVAGSDQFLGAPVLCAGGAARVGAGLITVASTRDVRLNVAAHLPEVTFTPADVVSGAGEKAARALEPLLDAQSAVVVGPGLGRGSGITDFVAEVLRLRRDRGHLVIDADGLFALSEMSDWRALLAPETVLTPHSGELERLLGHELSEDEPIWVQAGRLASEWGCVLVAKGPFTCVAETDGRVAVWPRANPALATGGTGDVLAGVCGGLLAQGMRAWDAARLAVGVHALAAERVVRLRGWRTLLASDLFEQIPAVLAELSF